MIIDSKTDWEFLFEGNIIHGDMVKAVVDIEQGLIAVEAEWHSELMTLLIEESGSNGNDTWGINLHPNKTIEYNSLINIKPGLNRSMDIEDEGLQEKVNKVVYSWLI